MQNAKEELSEEAEEYVKWIDSFHPNRRKYYKPLVEHEYYCFLDGYSSYNQITISLEDQEKTTFTCPYGTFSFR